MASASGSSTAHVLSRRAVVPRRLEVELGVRVGRVGALDHVDDDDGDVVAAALAVGHRHQLVGGGLRIGDRLDHLDDVVVADLVDEAVAAQEEAVAAHERQRPGVDADGRIDAQRSRHDVAPRVVARLVVGDVAGGDELLHVAVVDGDAPQPAVAQQVRARVADVDEGELLVGGVAAVGVGLGDHDQRGDRRAHPLLVRVADRRPVDVAVGLGDRRHHVVERGAVGAEPGAEHVDGEGAGDLAGAVAAHPVGDGEDVRLGEHVVLVLRADAARIGGRAPAQRRHYCASSTV